VRPTLRRARIAPSRRVEVKIAAGGVACLAHILDMGCGKRLATSDFGLNASRE